MKNRRNVLTNAGGGGPLLTGTIEESQAYNCHSEQRERAEAQSENHAFRGAVLRESSKTVSESVPRYEQVSNIGQTLKRVQGDNFLSLRADECRRGNPVKNTASPCCHAELRSLAQFGMTPPVKAASCLACSLKSHVQPLWMALSAWIATRSATARNDRKWFACVGFTMAEILLSLTIIGVVAAITLPSLTGNINERTWNTQRKALYARFSQAFPLLDSINTYSSGEAFVSGALAKVLKINNICDKDHIRDCGIVSSYTNLAGSQKSFPLTLSQLNSTMVSISVFYTRSDGTTFDGSFSQDDQDVVAFETQNGESIALLYSPGCRPSYNETSVYVAQEKVCVNMIYDLNGHKGPNTVGKDMGILTVYYPSDSIVVAPMPQTNNVSDSVEISDAAKLCTQSDSDFRLPNKEEAFALYVNRDLIGRTSGNYWTSSRSQTSRTRTVLWVMDMTNGRYGIQVPGDGAAYHALCVKR